MPQNISSRDDHEPVSSRADLETPRRFLATGPTFGADNRRNPVDAKGFETLSGFQMPQEPAAAPPRIRAITELTYGPPQPSGDAMGAPVNRVAIDDTTKYAWRLNAALLITVPGHTDTFQATGWFIGPYAVMTAAHVVFPREGGGHVGWASQIKVIPGLNGLQNTPPFGTDYTKTFYCPKGWQNHGEPRLDYGVVLLNLPLGQTVGTYGFATYASNDLLSAVANLSGYPVASPDGKEPQGRQWYAASNMVDVDNSFLYYDVGAQPGDSGSCVYRNIGSESYAMAIHSAGQGNLNRGIRITDAVYANMHEWKSMHA